MPARRVLLDTDCALLNAYIDTTLAHARYVILCMLTAQKYYGEKTNRQTAQTDDSQSQTTRQSATAHNGQAEVRNTGFIRRNLVLTHTRQLWFKSHEISAASRAETLSLPLLGIALGGSDT